MCGVAEYGYLGCDTVVSPVGQCAGWVFCVFMYTLYSNLQSNEHSKQKVVVVCVLINDVEYLV